MATATAENEFGFVPTSKDDFGFVPTPKPDDLGFVPNDAVAATPEEKSGLERSSPETALANYRLTKPELAAKHPELDDAGLAAKRAEYQAAWDALGPDAQGMATGMKKPIVPLPKPTGDSVAAGIGRGALNLAEGLETPENVMIMAGLGGAPGVVQKIAAGAFAADMASHVPEQVKAAIDANTPGEKAQAYTEAAGTTLLSFLAGSHALGRPSIPADVAARKAMFTEAERKALEHIGPNTAAEVRKMGEQAVASGEAQPGETPSQITPRSDVKESPVLGQMAGLWRQIQDTPPGPEKDALMAQLKALDAQLEAPPVATGGDAPPVSLKIATDAPPAPASAAPIPASAAEVRPEAPPAPASAPEPAKAPVVETPLPPDVVEPPENSIGHVTITSGSRSAKVTEYPDYVYLADIFNADPKGPGSAKDIFEAVKAKGKPIEVTVGRRSGDSDAARLARVYAHYGFKQVGEAGENGIPNRMRWEPPTNEQTVEEIRQSAVAEHGRVVDAMEALQKRIDDPATPPPEKAKIQKAFDELGDIIRNESRRQDEEAYSEQQGEQKDELLDVVKGLGGLPAKGSRHFAEHSGEIERVRSAHETHGSGGLYSSLFRNDARSVDDLRQLVNQRGFNFETPYDLLDAMENRLRSGEARYGEVSNAPEYTLGAARADNPVDFPERQPIGTYNAKVDEQRVARGLQPLLSEARKADPVMWAATEAKIEAEPDYPARLVEEIQAGKKDSVSDEEQAALLWRMVDLRNKRETETIRATDENLLPQERAEAEAAAAEYERQLQQTEEADRKAGTAQGRALRARRIMANEDFTLAQMERRARLANGGPLSAEQLADVQREADAIFQAQADLDIAENAEAVAAEAAEISRVHEAASQDEMPEVKWGKEVFEIARGIVKRWKEEAEASTKAFRQSMGQANIGLDPTLVLHVAKILRAKVGEFGLDRAEAFASVLAQLGEDARPYLAKAWEKMHALVGKEVRDSKVRKVVRSGTAKPVKAPVDVLATAKAHAVAGEELSHRLVFDYVRSLLRAGVKEADVMKAAHDGLKKFFPKIEQRDVNRAYVDYGKVRFPSKDELLKTERHLRQVTKIQEDIARLEKDNLDPLKQGLQRDKADIQIRDLMRKRNDLLKERTGPPSPEKLASIDEGKQTRLKNAIEEMDRQIQTEEKVARAHAAPDSPIVERLKAELKAMRDLWAEIDARKNPPPTPEQVQIDALSKIRQRLNDRLAGVTEAAKREDFKPLTQQAADIQAEILAMRELAAQIRRDAKPAKAEDAAQVKALEKAIENYAQKYRDLMAGKPKEGTKRLGPDTERVAALKDVLRQRQEMYRLAEKAGRPVKTAEERYNDTRMKSIERQLQEIEARIKANDFAPRAKKVPPALTDATAKKLGELQQRKLDFARKAAEWERARWNGFRKAWDRVLQVGALPRALNASFDVSAVGRQGGFLGLGNPKAMGKALGEMTRSMKSEENFRTAQAGILGRENAKKGYYDKGKLFLADRADTPLTAREEVLNSRWAEKIPLVGKGVRISNRAYVAFLNRLRADMFDHLAGAIGQGAELSKSELELIGNYINVATGRGDLGRMSGYADGLATVLFAPRLWASRWQMLTGQPIRRGLFTALKEGKPTDLRARRFIAQEYAKSLGAIGTILLAAGIAGTSVELDPRSSDFLKLRWGKTRVDITSGISQAAVDLTRLLTGKIKKGSGEDAVIAKQSRIVTAGNRVRNKFAPIPGAAWDALDIAQDVKTPPGHSATLGGVAGGLTLPISLQPTQIKALMKEQGIPAGMAIELLDLAGFSTQTYDTKK